MSSHGYARDATATRVDLRKHRNPCVCTGGVNELTAIDFALVCWLSLRASHRACGQGEVRYSNWLSYTYKYDQDCRLEPEDPEEVKWLMPQKPVVRLRIRTMFGNRNVSVETQCCTPMARGLNFIASRDTDWQMQYWC